MKNSKKFCLIIFVVTSLLHPFVQNNYALSNSAIPLNGTYTIGTGGNYTTINSAVSDLVALGVSGPVIFDIKTGSYDEQITIDSIPGASPINNVIFRSQTLNANDVNWYSSNMTSEFTLKINKADFLTVRNITFPDNNSSLNMRSRILFLGNNDDVKILNNIFSGGINNDYGLLGTHAQMKNLIIDGNFFDIRFGINFKGQGLVSTNTQITNNTLMCNNVIEIYYHSDLLIEKNNLKCTSAFVDSNSTTSSCISAAACGGSLRILKNKLICESINGPADGISVGYRTGPSVLVANNFISLQTGTGMWFSACTDVNVYFNTVRTSSMSSGDITFVQCSGINSKNNIMVNLGNFSMGSLTYYLIQSNFNSSDYNNFYYVNEFILYHTVYGYLNNLSQFKDSSGLDLHSIEQPVSFVSNTDLHLDGSSIGNEDLVGVPIAGITDDIDGNLRNPLYPYMGADEGDIPLPVELAIFIATVNRRDVTLKWITSREINNSGFEIQRINSDNPNPDQWSNIAFVEGNGNSVSSNVYSFIDYGLTTGVYKYRLKQIDFNGNSEYFNLINEVHIGIAQKYELSQNYPNPFNPTTKIDFNLPVDENVSIKVFDMTGKELKTIINEFRAAGYYSIDFNGSELSSGIYFYTFQSGNFNVTKQMMLIK
ncbi:MAG: T9SS type A sorting domain-containing protein [bacterium]